MNLDELVERVKGHTPGPWTWIDTMIHGDPVEGPDKDALVGPPRDPDAKPYPTDSSEKVLYFEYPIDNAANAELIAAAPSLLTLALELRKMLESIVQAHMVSEDESSCQICRPSYDHRHEEACPILAAERMLA